MKAFQAWLIEHGTGSNDTAAVRVIQARLHKYLEKIPINHIASCLFGDYDVIVLKKSHRSSQLTKGD